jgi:hypothetical protein
MLIHEQWLDAGGNHYHHIDDNDVLYGDRHIAHEAATAISVI